MQYDMDVSQASLKNLTLRVNYFDHSFKASIQSQAYRDIFFDLQHGLQFSIEEIFVEEDSLMLNRDGKFARVSLLSFLISNNSLDMSSTQVAIPQLSLWSQILGNLDYLHSVYEAPSLEAIFVQPTQNRIHNIYLLPFGSLVWMSWFIIIAVVYLTQRIRITKTKQPLALTDLCLGVVANVTQQGFGAHILSRKTAFSSVLLVVVGTILSMFMYWTYSVSLFTIITDSRIPVKSIGDLSAYGYNLVVHELSAASKEQSQVLTQIHGFSEGSTTDSEGEIKILIGQKNALISYWDLFYDEATKNQNYTDISLCSQFSRIQLPSYRRGYTYAIQKNFSSKNIFNVKILQMNERGLTLRLGRKTALQLSLRCIHEEGFSPVSSSEADLPFLIYFVGIGVALLIFQTEYFVFRWKKSRNLLHWAAISSQLKRNKTKL